MTDKPDPPVEAAEAAEDDVYEMGVDVDATVDTEIPTEWRARALYELEQPARCPYCRAVIRTLRVLRLSRLQVSFTSTLPRTGRAVVCSECDRILSVELGGFL